MAYTIPGLLGETAHTKIDNDSFFYFDSGFHYRAQAELELTHSSSASASQVPGLKVYTTMPR